MSSDKELSIEQKVFIVAHAIVSGSCTQAADEFVKKYASPAPPRTTISTWKQKLLETGSLMDRPRSGRPSLDENSRTAVTEYATENSNCSQREISRNMGISLGSVNRSLRTAGIKPYKYTFVQELAEDDPERRLEFCNWISSRSERWCRRIVFSDESTFYLNGQVNKHNLFYYSNENEHRFKETPMKSPGITVWAALSRSYYEGIVFDISDFTMTKERYVTILQETLSSFIPDGHLYQHDGAPPHFSLLARSWLDENLSGRWIGRRGPHEWPPRSPDLTPLDFWLWGYVKNKVYSLGCRTNSELKRAIANTLSNVSIEMVRNSFSEFYHRCRVCINEHGAHIEHLL